MTALAARQETLRLIDALPDDEILSALRFVKSLSATEQRPRKRTTTNDRSQTAKPQRKQLSEKQLERMRAAMLEVQESWAQHNDPRTVDQIVRDMRRGRQFDIR